MAATEVTQAQWKVVFGSNPAAFEGDDLPVEQVSWNDAQEFIRELNAKEDGAHFRDFFPPEQHRTDIGFRVVAVAENP
jgi:formylglycine-generating enzyme required for sulfatase activity